MRVRRMWTRRGCGERGGRSFVKRVKDGCEKESGLVRVHGVAQRWCFGWLVLV